VKATVPEVDVLMLAGVVVVLSCCSCGGRGRPHAARCSMLPLYGVCLRARGLRGGSCSCCSLSSSPVFCAELQLGERRLYSIRAVWVRAPFSGLPGLRSHCWMVVACRKVQMLLVSAVMTSAEVLQLYMHAKQRYRLCDSCQDAWWHSRTLKMVLQD
jgi:hypothetical protein